MTTVALSIGSNIERRKNVHFAIRRLREIFGEVRLSAVYENEAVGFDGPAFFNLAALINTALPLEPVLATLRAIEGEAGRVRGAKTYGSRTLDIDILLFGTQDLRSEGYNIPRDEIASAAYVLRPLADLLPDQTCRLLDDSFSAAWESMRLADPALDGGNAMRRVALDFSSGV